MVFIIFKITNIYVKELLLKVKFSIKVMQSFFFMQFLYAYIIAPNYFQIQC